MNKRLFLVGMGVVLDRSLKMMAIEGVVEISKNPGLFLVTVDQTWIVVGSILIIIILATQLKGLSVGFLLIIFGGLSNLFDRLIYGYVVDMIPLLSLSIFNLADVMIVIGCVIEIVKISNLSWEKLQSR